MEAQQLFYRYQGLKQIKEEDNKRAISFLTHVLGITICCLVLDVTAYVLLVVFSNSWYNGIFFGVILLYDLVGFYYLYYFIRHNKIFYEDTYPISQNFITGLLFFGKDRRDPLFYYFADSPLIKWRRRRFVTLVLYICVWLRSYSLACSFWGGDCPASVSLANRSSCQKTPVHGGGWTNPTNQIYNPQGAFPLSGDQLFDLSGKYVFCTLHVTWAYPNPGKNNKINGFTPNSDGSINCNNLNNNQGIIGILNYVPSIFCCPGTSSNSVCGSNNPYNGVSKIASFPDPTWGVKFSFLTGENIAISNTNAQTYCPGNQYLPTTCYSPEGNLIKNPTTANGCVLGTPYKICPVCLNYWRKYIANVPSTLAPQGYEHCPYDSYDTPFACFFCPGLGEDGGESWLAWEYVTQFYIELAFWLATTLTFFNRLLEYLMLLIMSLVFRRYSELSEERHEKVQNLIKTT